MLDKVQTISRSLQRGIAFDKTRCSARKIPIVQTTEGMKTKGCFLHAKSYRLTKPRQCGKKRRHVC